MEPLQFDPALLRRRPDVEAANLYAWDASDALLLDLAAPYLARLPGDSDDVVVLNDSYGGVTLGLTAKYGLHGVRVHQDLLTGEQALRQNAARLGLSHPDQLPRQFALVDDGGAALLTNAKLVLMKLPRALAELAEAVQAIARYASAEVQLIAVGRIKHMSLAMNSVLFESFSEVTAGLAQQKSRPLFASVPRPMNDEVAVFPSSSSIPELGLEVRAHAAAFAGATLDIGTRLLLETLRQDEVRLPETGVAVDLGCGTGLLAVQLAKLRPALRVIATDRSAAAVASAQATAMANGATAVEVLHDDAAASIPAGSVDVVLLNPPFHSGAAVHTAVGVKLLEAAARLLRPGGQLLSVYNRHLPYAKVLERVVGKTTLVSQNAKFVVMRSNRRR